MSTIISREKCISVGARLDVLGAKLAQHLDAGDAALLMEATQTLYSIADGRSVQLRQSVTPLLHEAVTDLDAIEREYDGVYGRKETLFTDLIRFDGLRAAGHLAWVRKAKSLFTDFIAKDTTP